jgi:hypothetical protein
MKKDSVVGSELGVRRKSKTLDISLDKNVLTTQGDLDQVDIAALLQGVAEDLQYKFPVVFRAIDRQGRRKL